MHWFRNLKIAHKLDVSFGLLVLLASLLGAFAQLREADFVEF